jgi:hypothetical protein
MIHLAGRVPIGSGKIRDVYVHPQDPDLLIKVISPKGWANAVKRWYRPAGPLAVFYREIREHRRLASRGHLPIHIQPVVGMTDTDLGLGLIVHAIRAAGGGYAPSLAAVDLGQYDPAEIRRAVSEFVTWAESGDAVLRDLHLANVVLQGTGAGYRLVMVDGFGNLAVLPIRMWFRSINRRRNQWHAQRLLREFNAKIGPAA